VIRLAAVTPGGYNSGAYPPVENLGVAMPFAAPAPSIHRRPVQERVGADRHGLPRSDRRISHRNAYLGGATLIPSDPSASNPQMPMHERLTHRVASTVTPAIYPALLPRAAHRGEYGATKNPVTHCTPRGYRSAPEWIRTTGLILRSHTPFTASRWTSGHAPRAYTLHVANPCWTVGRILSKAGPTLLTPGEYQRGIRLIPKGGEV
jgi:hypothetical protein